MIKVAKTAGFCYGVKRAVDEVYNLVDKHEKIATLGALIHNRQVVEDLSLKGVYAYNDVDDIPMEYKAVIRTHGVGKDIIDRLDELNHDYLDLTCPFVEKIHKIVREYHNKGYKIIIIGDENHPEVKGINGWCDNSALIFYTKNPKIPEEYINSHICIVAQTTINRDFFVQIVQIIKKTCQNTIVFDTICNATRERQEEAAVLSAQSDVMIVVGGRESSNTRKLFEISKSNCPATFHIETFEELPQNIYTKNKKIGITAGASTPGRIIEEVVRVMSENLKNEESFAELFEQSENKILNNGDIVDGVVIEVRNNEVIVDLGGFKYNGQLSAEQLTDDPTKKPSDIVKVGDTIKACVQSVIDSEGKVVLSRKKLIQQESMMKLKEAYEEGKVLHGKIVRAIERGVFAMADEGQVFIRIKEASDKYIQDTQSLVGKEVDFKIIEFDEKKRRVSGSVRVILEEEKKAKEDSFWAAAEVGKHYQGTVKRIKPFGAFVDIGGVDGLLHISELSWNRVKDPSEVVSEGDVIDVYIKDLDAENKKISLGFKKIEDNPWVIAKNKYNVGDVVDCKIVRLLPFGAFAQLMENVDGLIHISQISDKRIGKPEDVLTIGQEVQAKITDLDWDAKKISLSIRALIAPTPEEVKAEPKAEPEVEEQKDGEALVYSTDADVEVEEPINTEE